MKFDEIKGLDLKIDNSIHEICKTSNETSGTTRSILYVLLLVNILAIISVLNSYESKYVSNWTINRINKNVTDIDNILSSLPDTTKNKTYHDSILPYFNLEIIKNRLENNLKNEMENVHLVKVPVLGNQFDVNDLGLIGGITIIILMTIIRFTLSRESNNLKIALQAITNRYTDDANEQDFFSFLEKEENLKRKKELLAAINFVRRQHHYNFLSMNEIFNLPPLEIGGKQKFKTTEKIIMKMFWFPFIIYFIIFTNDLNTIINGFDLNKSNTIMLIIFEVIFSCVIFYNGYICTKFKETIFNLYSNFKRNNYKYIN